MVNYSLSLDAVFGSLADPVRRDILERLKRCQMTVSEIASAYPISLPAISKHLKVLEDAKLITKRKEGKKRMVALSPAALQDAEEYLERYRMMWQSRFDKLNSLLKEGE